jgi:hypothetical protein
LRGESQVGLPNIEFGKLVSTTFPGLFLAITIYMVVDITREKNLTAELFGGEAAVVAATLTYLVIASTLLGTLLDAFAHVALETTIVERLPMFKALYADRRLELRARGRSPDAFGGIYRVEVEQELRKQHIDMQYRYTEFSVNATLALMLFSVVFPLYLFLALGLAHVHSVIVALAMALVSGMLAAVAAHNLRDWEEVRTDLVLGTLDKGK